MLFRAAILYVVVGFATNQAIGAAIEAPREVGARAILIATDPHSACNCPNNCSYRAGHSCKYKAGPSTGSSTIDGKCVDQSGVLNCVPT